jgi:hypothetical protein
MGNVYKISHKNEYTSKKIKNMKTNVLFYLDQLSLWLSNLVCIGGLVWLFLWALKAYYGEVEYEIFFPLIYWCVLPSFTTGVTILFVFYIDPRKPLIWVIKKITKRKKLNIV